MISRRTKSSIRSLTGPPQAWSSSSKTSTNSSRSSYPDTSDTTRSTASSGSSTCTASTSHAQTTPKAYSAIPSSSKIESRPSIYLGTCLSLSSARLKEKPIRINPKPPKLPSKKGPKASARQQRRRWHRQEANWPALETCISLRPTTPHSIWSPLRKSCTPSWTSTSLSTTCPSIWGETCFRSKATRRMSASASSTKLLVRSRIQRIIRSVICRTSLWIPRVFSSRWEDKVIFEYLLLP